MKDFKDIKPGDKLYTLSYVNFGFPPLREWMTVTVKDRKGKTLRLRGGYVWGVSEKMYGSEFFPSKAEAAEAAADAMEYDLQEVEERLQYFRKELAYLRKVMKRSL